MVNEMKIIDGKLTISRLYSGDKNRNHAITITIEDEDNHRIIEVEMRKEEKIKAIDAWNTRAKESKTE